MKSKNLPKSVLAALVALSVFSFVFVNIHALSLQQAGLTTPATLVEPAIGPTEENPEPDSGPALDVAVLGYLLQLAGRFLPVAGG